MGLRSLSVVLAAMLAIIAEARGWRVAHYFAKPLTTLLILWAATDATGHPSQLYQRAIVAGLACSLVGDVFLMLPGDRFVPGLACFLLAHLCYIAAFTNGGHFRLDPMVLVPLGLLAGGILFLLWANLDALGLPVTLYVAVIVVMAWQAGSRWRSIGDSATALAAVGALLFVISDSALAIQRFRGPFPFATPVILGTYYTAQWLIASSV
jgi:uncharacterized membrane protein YhhN